MRLTNRAVGWKEDEVTEWVENRPNTWEESHDK
ncbi:MAG: AlpA family phage regulatory protein [Nitrospinae bacterium]|nr:AlpA family phage regulatory protein [Nitrospinota bacterium]